MARYLKGLSLLTRGIGILGVVGSLIGLLAAFSQRSSSDRLGFSLISLCVLLIAIVVWSTGTFHGSMAHVVPVIVRIDERLEEAQAAAVAARRAASLVKSAAPASDAAMPVTAAAIPGPLDWGVAQSGGGVTEADPVPAAAMPGPGAEIGVGTPEAAVDAPEPAAEAAPVIEEAKPEPVRTPCPHCGGLTHPEATRCVHCLKHIARS